MVRYFRAGYLEGRRRLPPKWSRLARLVDLVALCEMLTHDVLPDRAAAELVDLMRAAADNPRQATPSP